MSEKEALVKFYNECIANGYTDMLNSTHSLKAKVIASDLNLDYSNISELFSKAKKEAELKELKGEALFTVHSSNDKYQVCKCSNGTTYCESSNTGEKFKIVRINVKSRKILSYTYHPSKVIYTGASSGGVSMGGFHTTKDYTTMKSDDSDNGYITLSAIGLNAIDISKITIDKNVFDLIKTELHILGYGQTIMCEKEISKSESDAYKYVLMNSYSKGSAEAASTSSVIASKFSLTLEECEYIANIINDILRNKITKRTESEYLQEIEQLIEKDDIDSLTRAKNIIEFYDKPEFKKYSKKLNSKYDDAIQKIKEQKILEEEQALSKEKSKEKRKNIFILVASIIIGLVMGIFVGITAGAGFGIFMFFGGTIVSFFSIGKAVYGV